MSYTVRAEIPGMADLLSTLDGMKKGVRNKIIRPAITAASRLVAKEAKRTAPRELGLLSKSIGSKVKTYQTGAIVGIIGPRKGFRKQVIRKKGKWRPAAPKPSGYADPVKYAHLVELGTKPHGKHPGTTSQPFMANALKATAGAVRDLMAQRITDGLAKIAAQKGKVS